ncbi:TetR family transcriptional regulator [Actinokineospora bangkokensis]|uniref:TetR family transcriptional regulator n=1 Tax=Actinokineospora bangkokensis TaxID=1193682 RepID=A0A1Q9LLE5_9PSEU|nr:TetR family transcriptional regulator [Actinokineospora bangkokensis]
MPAAERRAQILAVATRLIGERGYWALSLQDVADECGLTVPGLLHHVPSKDALLVAVLGHRDERDAESLARELGGPVADADLERVCAALVRRNATQPEIVRLFAVLEVESLTPGHPAHDYFRHRQRETLRVLASLARGHPDPARLALQVVSAMDGLQVQWLRDPGDGPRCDLVAEWDALAARLFADRT